MDPRKVIALSEELNQAIAQQRRGASGDKRPSLETETDSTRKTA
jgi:hypothetical protein